MNSSLRGRKPSRMTVGMGMLVMLCVGIAAAVFLYRTKEPSTLSISDTTTTPVSYNTLSLHFEIATTTAEQERGLSGRKSIPNNFGMLFVFPKPDRYGFWMKDMLESIDIIWLSDSGTIVGIENSLSPSSYPQVFYPPEPVRYVLEIRAGGAAARGWHVGAKVPLPLPYGK